MPQAGSPEVAVAEGRSGVHGPGQILSAEVTVGENHSLGVQFSEIRLGEVVTGERLIHPVLHRHYRRASGTSKKNIRKASRIQTAPCQIGHTPPALYTW